MRTTNPFRRILVGQFVQLHLDRHKIELFVDHLLGNLQIIDHGHRMS